MDTVAQCEQLARDRGENERQSPWRIYFRKEFFTPWHDSQEDPVSTQLIYRQVLHGVWSGEYNFEKVRRPRRHEGALRRTCQSAWGTTVFQGRAGLGFSPQGAPHRMGCEEYGEGRGRRQRPGMCSWSAGPQAPLLAVQLYPPSLAPSSSCGPRVCSGLQGSMHQQQAGEASHQPQTHVALPQQPFMGQQEGGPREHRED